MISRSDKIHPRDMFEREVMKKYGKNEARKIILDRRQYLSDNASYINGLESQSVMRNTLRETKSPRGR